jgi:hypothetical protein
MAALPVRDRLDTMACVPDGSPLASDALVTGPQRMNNGGRFHLVAEPVVREIASFKTHLLQGLQRSKSTLHSDSKRIGCALR